MKTFTAEVAEESGESMKNALGDTPRGSAMGVSAMLRHTTPEKKPRSGNHGIHGKEQEKRSEVLGLMSELDLFRRNSILDFFRVFRLFRGSQSSSPHFSSLRT